VQIIILSMIKILTNSWSKISISRFLLLILLMNSKSNTLLTKTIKKLAIKITILVYQLNLTLENSVWILTANKINSLKIKTVKLKLIGKLSTIVTSLLAKSMSIISVLMIFSRILWPSILTVVLTKTTTSRSGCSNRTPSRTNRGSSRIRFIEIWWHGGWFIW